MAHPWFQPPTLQMRSASPRGLAARRRAGRACSGMCLKYSRVCASLPCAALLLPTVPSTKTAGMQSPRAFMGQTDWAEPRAHSPVHVPGSLQVLRVRGMGRERDKHTRLGNQRKARGFMNYPVGKTRKQYVSDRRALSKDVVNVMIKTNIKVRTETCLGFSKESSGFGPHWSDYRQGIEMFAWRPHLISVGCWLVESCRQRSPYCVPVLVVWCFHMGL